MDDADRADQEVERMREEALRHRKHDHLPHISRCYNCGEVAPGRLFCDADCQSDYEKRAAARARGGR